MTPKLIVMKEAGYKLRIANAPLNSTEVSYRKAVEPIILQYGEQIGYLGRTKLDLLKSKLGLSDEIALSIEQQVLEPIRQRKTKLAQYREIFVQAVEEEYPFEDLQLQFLTDIKNMLGVLDEDVQLIESEILSGVEEPELRPVTVSFDRLEKLLNNQNWKEANSETSRLLLLMTNRQEEGSLLVGHIRHGLSQDGLNTVDKLWADASEGRFGFGIQGRLFFEHIKPLNLPRSEAWPKMDELLAWRQDYANRYEFSLNAAEGHLPHWRQLISGWGVSDRGHAFMDRCLNCPVYETEATSAQDVIIEASVAEQLVIPEKYQQLETLLQEKQWREADKETYFLMITTVGKSDRDWFSTDDLENFPCEDLRFLDRLWVKYSNGKFGFSVQKKIWQDCGSPNSYNENWERFGDRVGWRKHGDWLEYSQFLFKKTGALPVNWDEFSDDEDDDLQIAFLLAREDL